MSAKKRRGHSLAHQKTIEVTHPNAYSGYFDKIMTDQMLSSQGTKVNLFIESKKMLGDKLIKPSTIKHKKVKSALHKQTSLQSDFSRLDFLSRVKT